MSGCNRSAEVAKVANHGRAWLAGCLLAAMVVTTGCGDYRMSLSDFLAMREQAKTDAATTQPAEPVALPAEEAAIINKKLGPYRVGPGDVLAVDVIGPEQAGPRTTPGMMIGNQGVAISMPGTSTRVDRNGDIRITPNVGKLHVADMELEDVETAILDALVDKKVFTDRDQVTVTVGLAAPYMTDVLVKGAAVTPGLVHLRRSERTPVHALAAAGGATQIASGEITLKRLRQPGHQQSLNLFDPAQLRTALTIDPLESGDILEVVAAQPNTIFVGGLVQRPGPQPYAPETRVTLLQALAGASGLRTDVSPRWGTLSTQVNGQDVHVKLDLERIQRGQDPNITLAAGDIVWVPFTLSTRIEDWINRNVFFRIGASVNANYGLDYSMPGVDYLNSASARQALRGTSNGSTLQDTFDPFGFILQNQTLNNLTGK